MLIALLELLKVKTMPADVKGTWLHAHKKFYQNSEAPFTLYALGIQKLIRLWSNSAVYTHTELLFWDDYNKCSLFSILSADPPEITQHPKHQSVSPGADVPFTVEATGDDLPFQRQKDDKDIDRDVSQLQYSQTDKSSTLHTHKRDKGHYGCHVKNPAKNSGKISHTAERTDCKFSLACILCWCWFIAW